MRSRSHDFENGVRTSVDLSSEQPNRVDDLSLPTMVFSETIAFTQSPRSCLRRYSNVGLPKAGVNICAWLVPSSGAFASNKPGFVIDISYLDGRVEQV